MVISRGSPAPHGLDDLLEGPPPNILVNDPNTDEFPYITQVEPSLAVFDSNVVVAWNDSAQSTQCQYGFCGGLGYGYSTDGGSTFVDAGGLDAAWGADPTVAVDAFGNFYVGRLAPLQRSSVAVHKSTDRGVTFEQVAPPLGFRGLADKPFVTVDNTGAPFDGHVYVTWTDALGILTIMLSRSTDGGTTFSAPVRVSPQRLPNNQASMPAIGPDGEVFVVWLAHDRDEVYVSRSSDGGLAFEPEVLVAAINRPGSRNYCVERARSGLKGNIRVSNAPIIAIDRSQTSSRGNIYVVFSADPDDIGPDMADVFLIRSTDSGYTWSEPRRLNDDETSNDQWQPFVSVAENGALGVMWYDRRADDENLLIDVYMTLSTDGGSTFSPNFRITDVSFPVPDAAAPCSYMGSYNFMVANRSHFCLAWTDNRLVVADKPDPNIFFTKVPIPRTEQDATKRSASLRRIVGRDVLLLQLLVESPADVQQARDAVPGFSRPRQLVRLARNTHH